MAENMWESSWQQLTESFANEDGPRVPFMKLQPGKNVIRIASNPSKIYQHWEKTFDGKLRKVTCIGKECPLCAIGHQPSARYQLKILDKLDPDDPQAKVLETGAAVIRQISNYANDEDYGNPLEYDIKIQKEGIGRETRYSVTASPHKRPLSDREKLLIDQLPDIQDINKELTKEQILNLGLVALDAENEDFSDPQQGNYNRPGQYNTPSQGFNSADDYNKATPTQRKSQAMEEWESL